MADLAAEYRLILSEEYKKRAKRNPRYTQSAFARSLGVDRTYLSKLTAGNILLSLDIADQITLALRLSPELRKVFLLSAAEEQRCHALYLTDPSLTECEPEKREINVKPPPRGKLVKKRSLRK